MLEGSLQGSLGLSLRPERFSLRLQTSNKFVNDYSLIDGLKLKSGRDFDLNVRFPLSPPTIVYI